MTRFTLISAGSMVHSFSPSDELLLIVTYPGTRVRHLSLIEVASGQPLACYATQQMASASPTPSSVQCSALATARMLLSF